VRRQACGQAINIAVALYAPGGDLLSRTFFLILNLYLLKKTAELINRSNRLACLSVDSC